MHWCPHCPVSALTVSFFITLDQTTNRFTTLIIKLFQDIADSIKEEDYIHINPEFDFDPDIECKPYEISEDNYEEKTKITRTNSRNRTLTKSRFKKTRTSSPKSLETDLFLFECENCSETFKSLLLLELHSKGEHESFAHSCDRCDEIFNTTESLMCHIRLRSQTYLNIS